MIWNFATLLRAAAFAALALTLVDCSQERKSFNADGVTAGYSEHDARLVAVSHSFTLQVPASEIEAVQHKHLVECRKLGCTVLNTRLDRSSPAGISARTSVRVAPTAFGPFVAAITAAPAEVVAHSESSDDKTVAVLDIEKRVEIKTALRDRLNAMLRDPTPRAVADLLAIEKELTQVQGEIESAVAQRDYLRTQTDTVRIDITYRVTGGTIAYAPISQALRGSGRTVVESAGAMIVFLAAALPWLPLILLIGWGARRLWRRRVAKRVVEPPPA